MPSQKNMRPAARSRRRRRVIRHRINSQRYAIQETAGMKRNVIILGAILDLGATAAEAVPYQWGSFSVEPGQTKHISLVIGREVRVCNNFESAASISVAVGPHDPHHLAAGVCTDDIGSDIIVINQGSGTAYGTWAPSYGHQTGDAGSSAGEVPNLEIGPRK